MISTCLQMSWQCSMWNCCYSVCNYIDICQLYRQSKTAMTVCDLCLICPSLNIITYTISRAQCLQHSCGWPASIYLDTFLDPGWLNPPFFTKYLGRFTSQFGWLFHKEQVVRTKRKICIIQISYNEYSFQRAFITIVNCSCRHISSAFSTWNATEKGVVHSCLID